VLIVSGMLLSNDSIQHFGLLLLGITLALNAAMLLIRDIADGEKFWGRALRVVAVGIVFVAAIIFVLVAGALIVDPLWNVLDYIHSRLRSSA